jgi:hypothetical protein
MPNAPLICTWDRPAFQCRNISTKSVTFHDLLATSAPFQDPLVGHLNGANLSSTPTPAGHAPRGRNYVTDNPSYLGNYVTADRRRP